MSGSAWKDEELITRVVAGETEALGLLYDRYGRLVFSLAVRMLGEPELAEEITQDVFLQVWNKAALYNPAEGRLSTWLGRMAHNRGIDLLRRMRVRPEGHAAELADELLSDAGRTGGIEHGLEQSEEEGELHRAIASLPGEQRRVLALAYFGGLSHQEIANQLGEPLGTVKTRLRLAMLKLRTALVSHPVSLE